MSTVAVLISSIVTVPLFAVIDFVLSQKTNSGKEVSAKKRFVIEWVSTFVFYLMLDVVSMLFGERIGVWDFVASVILATAFALLSLLWQVLKKAIRGGKAAEREEL